MIRLDEDGVYRFNSGGRSRRVGHGADELGFAYKAKFRSDFVIHNIDKYVIDYLSILPCVTLSNVPPIRDERIDGVECTPFHIFLQLSNRSIPSWNEGDIIYGSKEWRCKRRNDSELTAFAARLLVIVELTSTEGYTVWKISVDYVPISGKLLCQVFVRT